MKAELEQSTAELLTRDDLPALLTEANLYMKGMRDKQRLIEAGMDVLPPELPAKHKVLLPLINMFYDDLRGWADYLRELRDRGGWTSKQVMWRKLQELQRVAFSNWSQSRRRQLAGRAADLYETTHAAFRRGQRTTYMTWVQKSWTAAFEIKRKNARANCGLANLPVEENNRLSVEFWDARETEINNGQAPIPPAGLLD